LRKKGITFCNVIVPEDTPHPLHNTQCVPNRVGKHDFLWKITGDVLADAFGILSVPLIMLLQI
jgi:hypothetical protein